MITDHYTFKIQYLPWHFVWQTGTRSSHLQSLHSWRWRGTDSTSWRRGRVRGTSVTHRVQNVRECEVHLCCRSVSCGTQHWKRCLGRRVQRGCVVHLSIYYYYYILYTSNIHYTDLETFQNFQSARDIHRLHKHVRNEQINKFTFTKFNPTRKSYLPIFFEKIREETN